MIAIREKKNIHNKRRVKRFSHRCKITFSVGGVTCRGLSSNFSLDGIFVRTRNTCPPGTLVDITIFFPNELTSHLRGRVIRASQTPGKIAGFRDPEYGEKGMGIRILEKDALYLHFIRALLSQEEEDLFGNLLFSEREASYRKIRSELQRTSHIFDAYALLIGEHTDQAGFMGKAWFEAKIRNNTDYLFVDPVVTFLTAKHDDPTGNVQKNSLPELGTVLMNTPRDNEVWRPGEVILLAGEIDSLSLDALDYEIAFLDSLIRTRAITAEEPVNIDDLIETVWIGAPCIVPDPLPVHRKEREDFSLK
ncbi:MAG: PilZ domain-containing protein [Nitrospirota bacterium]